MTPRETTTSTGITTPALVGCPECRAPAEILDRFVLEGTDGPVEHVTVRCVRRHRFTMLTSSLTV